MKKPIITVMVFACAAIAAAQDKPAAKPSTAAATTAKQATTSTADPVIVSAGDVTIKQSEFESALKTLPPEYQQFAAGPGKKQFAEDYLRMKMLAAEGMKSGLDKDPDVVRQLNLLRENLVANAELGKIEKSITISDADLQKSYDAQKNDYERVKASHILVAFKGSPAAQPGKPELTDEQAKAKAEDLRKQIVAGAKFEDVAKKESDDTGSGAQGGSLGSFARGQMVPEFEAAAFTAKPGEITPVVKTQFGYHIIKVEEHTTTPFADIKDQLEKKERQKRVQERLDTMKKNANVTFNDAYFNPPTAAAEPKKQ